MTTRFNVLMLGYQRVGKTSLLASMYKATQDELAENYRFQIRSGDDKTSEFLGSAEDKLASATEFLVNDTVAPSDTWRTFLFDIVSEGKTVIQLDFLDYRGGKLRDQSSEDATKVREWLQTCIAIVIPVDAPSLMESIGEWVDLNDKWNNPSGIEKILRAEQNRDAPRLVILAPVKCEKYIQDGRGEELRRKVETVYDGILKYLKGEADLKGREERSKNCVVVVPVQTIGGARFSAFEKQNDGTVQARFVNPTQTYDPKDGDQLLRYIARFALARIAEENLIRVDELTEQIINDLGWCPNIEDVESNEAKKTDRSERLKMIVLLRSGLQLFAQGCKKDGIFRILIGGSLLNIGR